MTSGEFEPPTFEPPKFEPKKLSRESIEVPIEGHWRSVAPEDAKRFHDQALAAHRKFAPFGPRIRRRLVKYVLYGALGYSLFAFLFLVQPPYLVFAALGVVAGLAVALLRTGDFTTGLILGGTVFTAMSAMHGPSLSQFLFTASSCLLFGSIGIPIGRGEELKRIDGED